MGCLSVSFQDTVQHAMGLGYRERWTAELRCQPGWRYTLALDGIHAEVPTLGLQIAQNRSHLQTLGPKVGTIYVLGALRLGESILRFCTISYLNGLLGLQILADKLGS